MKGKRCQWVGVSLLGAAMVAFLAACFTINPHTKWALEEKSPAELLQEGMDFYNDGGYPLAKESFQKVVDRYPYSKESVEAELKLADCLYHQHEHDSAFDAYNEFQRLHPKNLHNPYVYFQMGMCHFEQTSTIDREQSHTQQAKENFERLMKKYPNSEYAAQARWKIRECYKLLAGAELYVANFYFKMEKYKAAMIRYRYLLENFPDMGHYQEAILKLSQCKKKLQM